VHHLAKHFSPPIFLFDKSGKPPTLQAQSWAI
jgi:hypothetical protein